MTSNVNVKWAIETIVNYYKNFYNININDNDRNFLNSILQKLDSNSWREGYQDCRKDEELD